MPEWPSRDSTYYYENGVRNLLFLEAKHKYEHATNPEFKRACSIRLGVLAEEEPMARNWLLVHLSSDEAPALDPLCLSLLLLPFKKNTSPQEISTLYRFFIRYEPRREEEKLGVIAHLAEIFGLWDRHLSTSQRAGIILKIGIIRRILGNQQIAPNLDIQIKAAITILRGSLGKQVDDLTS